MKSIDCRAAAKGFFFSDPSAKVSDGHLPFAFVVLLGFGIWLLSHPYWGIWHDARVYTLMAIRWLNPEAFSRDPWFMFGSQDAYSLFSPIYGSAIAIFGISAAAKWGSFLAGALYVWACWVFSRVLPLRRSRDLVFLLLVSVPLVFCINGTGFVGDLRVSESYITSRPFAISFGIAGVAAEIARRRYMCLALLGASAALHPLMAVWPILLVLCVRVRVSLFALVAIALVGSVAVVGLSAYGGGVFRPIAGEWGDLLRATGRIVFVGTDAPQRLDFVLVSYSILLVGARWGDARLRRWYQVALLLSASAYTVNWVCSDYFPAAIVMQVQLWRANWIALLWAAVVSVELALRLGAADRMVTLLSLVIGNFLLLFPVAGVPAVVCAVCSAERVTGLVGVVQSRVGGLAIVLVRIATMVVLAVLGVVLLGEIQAAGAMVWRAGDSADGFADLVRGLVFTGGYGLLAATIWFSTRIRALKIPLMLGSIVVSVLGLWLWDDRTQQGRQFEEMHWGTSLT